MNTLFLSADKAEDIQRAGDLLKAGELVAVPTETVYGLAADASNPEAIAKIFEAKGRPSDHPLIVHIGSVSDLNHWTTERPDWLPTLAEQFWPGPLTLILDKANTVPSLVTGGLPTVGLRVPSHPALLSLLQSQSIAVAAPSANPYKKLSPTSAQQVYEVMQGKIAAVLDGGPCNVGTESTILRVSEEKAEVLRSGPIKAEDLQPFLDRPVHTPKTHDYAVSGNKRDHYQPDAALHLVSGAELAARLSAQDATEGFLVFSPELGKLEHPHLVQIARNDQAYRQALYATLYALDKQNLTRIFVEMPPEDEAWLDVWDRLTRAASK